MDPYHNDPYATTPVRYPTTSYVSVAPAPSANASMGGVYEGQSERFSGASTERAGAGSSAEIPGAPSGNVRYRVMSLPTGDDDDIEDVVAQVGLDGVRVYAAGDESRVRRAFDLQRVARWSLNDPTILTVWSKESDGDASISLSADARTISALVDVLTTSAYQWCELNGLDAFDTIVSSGSEWTNLRASASNGSAETHSSSLAASIRFWDNPEYSGWLTKQGEMLKTWRKRWFVLKEEHLVWYKTNIVDTRVVFRGVIPLNSIESVSAASEAAAGKPFAICLDGALPAKQGTRFLIADSERERAQWIEALQKAMREQQNTSSPAPSSSTAERLRQGFAQATTPTSSARPSPQQMPPRAFADPSSIQIEFQGYASPASSAPPQRPQQTASYVTLPPLPFAHPSSAAGAASFNAPPAAPVSTDYYPAPAYAAATAPADEWTTYHTPEGKPYYFNAKTGESSWDRPR